MCSRQKRRISPFIRTEETGRRLRSLLASRGLTVKDVQKYLGLSCPQSIYRWLDGKSMTPLRQSKSEKRRPHSSCTRMPVENRNSMITQSRQ